MKRLIDSRLQVIDECLKSIRKHGCLDSVQKLVETL